MKTATKIILIIATACLVGGIALSTTAYVLADFDLRRLSTVPDYVQSNYQAEKADYEEIIVNGASENISIVRTSGDVVEVEYYENEQQTFSITEKENALEITEDHRPGFMLFNFDFRDTSLVVKIPASFEGSLRLNSASGNVTLHDLGKVESMSVENASGDVFVSGAVMAGSLEANSTSGSIDANDITSSDVTLKTASGDITTQTITADQIYIDSASGSLDANTLTASDITLKTISGDIEGLIVGVHDDYRITATSTSGDIHVPSGNTQASKSIMMESVSGSLELSFVDAR